MRFRLLEIIAQTNLLSNPSCFWCSVVSGFSLGAHFMKKLTTHAIAAAMLIVSFTPIRAQEATPVGSPPPLALDKPVPVASPAPPQPGIPVPQPLPLMPQTAKGTPAKPSAAHNGIGALTQGKKGKLPVETGTIDELRRNVRIRELTIQILQENAEIREWRVKADHTRTYAGERAALRNYYTLLYTQIEKLDPSLHDVVERRLYTELFALEQHRIRPSKLIEPIVELPGSHSADHAAAKSGPGSSPTVPREPEPAPTPFMANPADNDSF